MRVGIEVGEERGNRWEFSTAEFGASGWTGTLIGVCISFLAARSLLGTDVAPGADGMFHVIRAEHAQSLLQSGRLDGWMPSFFSGHEAFLFNSGGFPLAAAFLSLISFGLVSPALATLLLTFVSFLAFPVGVAYLARSFGMSGLASGIAAALSTLVTHYLGFGISGVFDLGLLAHQFASPLWALSLGLLIRTINTDDKFVHARAASVAIVTCLCSPLTAEIVLFHFVVIVVISMAANQVRLEAVLNRLVPVTFLTVFGTMMWWLPAWAHRDLFGTRTGGAKRTLAERAEEIFLGTTGLPKGLLIFALAAVVILIVPRVKVLNRPALALGGISALVLGHVVGQSGWGPSVLAHLPDRALTHGLVLLVLPLAVVTALAGQAIHRRTGASGIVPLIGVAAIGILAWPVVGYGSARVPQPTDDLVAIAQFLDEETPEGSRFGVVDHFGLQAVSGVPAPNIWLSEASGVPVATGLGLESTNTWVAAEAVTKVDRSAEAAQRLVVAGVTHLVMVNGTDVELANSQHFDKVAASGELVVWEVEAKGLEQLPIVLVDVSSASQNLTYDLGGDPPAEVDLPLAYSPKWEAEDKDGRKLAISRSDDGLIRLVPTAGSSLVELRFTPDRYDRVGEIATILGLLGAIGFGFGQPMLRRIRKS